MPITKDGGGTISYTEKRDRWDSDVTGVFADIDFAVSDDLDPTKQIQFSASNQTSNSKITIEAGGNVADIVLTLPSTSGSLGGGGGVNSFTTIQPDLGTSPVATSGSDTLTLTSSDNSIQITGNSGTDTIDLVAVGGGGSNSFETIAVPNGTNPVADSSTDTLTFTSADGNVTITGTAGTDTIDFSLPATLDGITKIDTGVIGSLTLEAASSLILRPSTTAGTNAMSITDDGTDMYLGGSGAGALCIRPKGTDDGEICLMGYTTMVEQATTPTVLSGYGGVYPKSDGNLYYKSGAGAEVQLNGGGGGITEAEVFARVVYGA